MHDSRIFVGFLYTAYIHTMYCHSHHFHLFFLHNRFIATAGAQIGMKLIQIMMLWLTLAAGSVMYRLIPYTQLISTARRLGYQSFMQNLQLECLWEQLKVDRSTRLFVQTIYISKNCIISIVVYNIEISTFHIPHWLLC